MSCSAGSTEEADGHLSRMASINEEKKEKSIMSLLVKMTLSAALVLSIGVPFGAFAAGEKTKGRYKTALGVNVFLFFGTMIAAAAFMFSGNAFAAEEKWD